MSLTAWTSAGSFTLGAHAAAHATARERCRAVIATRDTLTADLCNLGFEVLPSAANFIFARHPQRDAAELAKALREESIIVRHFKLPRIDQFLRITIGTPEESNAQVPPLALDQRRRLIPRHVRDVVDMQLARAAEPGPVISRHLLPIRRAR